MVKRTLQRKLLRDLWKNRMQFVAMILLCALGTFAFGGLDAAWRMIDLSAGTYYDQQNLADLWITLQSADREVLGRISRIDGVRQVQSRASAELEVDLGHDAWLRTEAWDGEILINLPLMLEGEALDENDLRGCLLDSEFAHANGFRPGDRIGLKLGGATYDFVIRGLCMSPEFTALSKDVMPDPSSYGFVLINSRAMPVLPLNTIVLTLQQGAESAAVEAAVKALYPEALIVNHTAHSATHGIQKDVDMFRNLSYLFPLLCFGVSAMIVLTTITRLMENQRVQMGTLKALGYSDRAMLNHYMSYAFYPSLAGSLLGLFVGRNLLPYILWSLEEAQFTLPYRLQAPVSAGQWLMCALSVALSCAICYRTYSRSAREQTAQLLRPKPPRAGRKLMLERIGFVWRRLGFNGKMVVRNLMRNKLRMMMSLMGVGCCTMLLITSLGLQDSVIFFTGKYYDGTIQYTLRADLTSDAGTVESYRRRIGAEQLEGVMERSLSIRAAQSERTTMLTVMEDDQQLMHLGREETWTALPQEGVMLTQKLAQVLKASIGDRVELWLPGDDEPFVTTVGAIAEVTVGQSAMMRRSVWEQSRKGDFVPTALLIRQPSSEGLLKLETLDEVEELIDPQKQHADTLSILDSLSRIFMILSIVALGLAFVVLYNMGILNYMERYREYATLKVLGYHQKEIRRLMSSENNLLTLIGIVLGLFPGWWLTGAVMRSCESDSMVFASTVEPASFAVACVVTYVFSWMITRFLSRKVRYVDMVEALKSVE